MLPRSVSASVFVQHLESVSPPEKYEVVLASATEESMLNPSVGASLSFRHREPVSPPEKHVVVSNQGTGGRD